MNFLDIVILATFALGFYGGYRKGFLQTFKGLVVYVGSFLGALLLYKPFADFLTHHFLMERQLRTAAKAIVDLPPELRDMPATTIKGEAIAASLDKLSLPQGFQAQAVEVANRLTEISQRSDIGTVSDAIYFLIGGILLQILSFTILIILTGLAIKGLFLLIGKSEGKTKTGSTDQWIGGFIGLGKQVATVVILLLLLYPVISMGAISGTNKGVLGQFTQAVQGSAVCTSIL